MTPRINTKSGINKSVQEKIVPVRYQLMYGLVVEKYKSDTISINRGIVSTPNILYYSNNTKCLFDYSNQTNNEIEEKVNKYFEQIPYGTNLVLYNAYYKDPTSEEISDLSGTYVFRGYQNGIVHTDVTSVESLSARINRYDKTKFEQIPFIVSASLAVPQEKTIIKNRFGINTKNSFNYLGAKVGDYIKYPAIDRPIRITNIDIDSDGNEFIEIDADLQTADYTDDAIKITLYIATVGPIENVDIEEKEVGACIEYSNGVLISCTNNHTISQCRVRSSTNLGINTELTLGTFCATPETDTAIQKDTTDSIVQLTNTLANAVFAMNTVSSQRNKFYGRNF
jgi:hypothetical protein